MNGGPFEISKDHKSVLRKSDLKGGGIPMLMGAAD